jgi:uncharacterized damage-inducible protein DinB
MEDFMKRMFVLIGLVILVSTGLAFAEAPATTGVRAEILAQMNNAADKMIQLADATPAEKFSWRPADGVRSISEVYEHVSGANYMLAQMIGMKPPMPYDEKMEKTVTEKAKVVADLKQSMDYLRKLVTDVPDGDMEKQVDYFGTKTTVRGALFAFAAHLHEHLGQSIAYARMNGIVPPWSAKEKEQEQHATH